MVLTVEGHLLISKFRLCVPVFKSVTVFGRGKIIERGTLILDYIVKILIICINLGDVSPVRVYSCPVTFESAQLICISDFMISQLCCQLQL